MTSASSSQEPLGFLRGGGELGALMRAKDWSTHPLEPPETWTQSIKTAVSLCLNSRFPILLWLGPELRIVYNNAYIPFLGETKHPAMLGAPGREAWSEIWPAIGPMHDEVRAGRATWVEDLQFFFARRLPLEEVYVTFSYSPILAEDARTLEGVFCVCTETTERVLGERRLSTLRDLGLRVSEQRTVDAACRKAVEVLDANPLDIPFAAIYLLDEDGATARRTAGARLPDDPSTFPAVFPLSGHAAHQPWPLAAVARTQKAVEVRNLPSRGSAFVAPLWPDLVQTALILPLEMQSQSALAGFFIVGISPRRVLDADYRSFLALVAGHIAGGVADARAFESERRRAEALADIDRAKTIFFSNVSHEFRTPLTLMISPLEELLAKPEGELPEDGRVLVTMAHRNSLRLLKLVNVLLDFSRIEAGRAQAAYEPTDLSRFTAELASNFGSLCERAGLRFDIACPPLPQPVYVDRDMWEKIVLNLLSNAIKYTFEGGITVRMAATADGVALRVSDTGIGIPTADLPQIFKRFHRIEGQKGRSFEGSGIGLALVQELVHLHCGTITAESKVGRGTTFTVGLPFGTGSLPAERVGVLHSQSLTSAQAAAYVEEALRWLPSDDRTDKMPRLPGEVAGAARSKKRARILLADDNADMRDYLIRLLSAHWDVVAVPDGQEALEAVRRCRPDLVLSDVMMPRLGGVDLVTALRREPKLADVPIILLSARAGEAAQVEGLAAGADDYVIKPFAARELLARANSALALSRQRHDAADRVRRSEARLRAAVDLVGMTLYSWDPTTDALEWDARLKAMWGLPPEAHVDVDIFLGAIHPDDRPRVEAAIAHCLDPRGDGVYAIEYRVIGIEDGLERWVSTHGQTVFDAGRPLGFIGAALDITARKRAEDGLRESEERFRQFAAHSASVLWIVDVGTMRMEYLSPAYEHIWGEPPDAMLQDWRPHWLGTVHPEDRELASGAMDRVLQGETVDQEYRIVRGNGSVRWIRDTFFAIRSEGGRIRRVAGIAQDITNHSGSLIYVINAEEASQRELLLLLRGVGYDVKAFTSARAFLEIAPALIPGCVLLDIRAPETDGLAIPRELRARRIHLPVIVMGSCDGDIRLAVRAMKAGAVDFLEVPYEREALLAAVASALADIRDTAERSSVAEIARARIADMSTRERAVLEGLLAGGTNKTMARDLGISPRTVENHRAHVMERLGARTLPEAVLMAAAAGLRPPLRTQGETQEE
ncbi:response regulator (plasmid) [Azospirillum argentinense]|uniref:histidine kinase n=2 Tax=Azospirillum TaxID=191 RepID=A0A4D8Q0B2_AZOBR|nr:response regulator [Azospirillum argentinense]